MRASDQDPLGNEEARTRDVTVPAQPLRATGHARRQRRRGVVGHFLGAVAVGLCEDQVTFG